MRIILTDQLGAKFVHLGDFKAMRYRTVLFSGLAVLLVLTGCSSSDKAAREAAANDVDMAGEYVIGPGDQLQVFVWEHPDVSISVPVRPDGRISTPLVEDMQAVGKTPKQLARDIETALSEYIRSPTVNIIVTDFVGTFDKQIRVVGEAGTPQALPYRRNMTLLDVMIAVGGLTENASGNRAKIIRQRNGQSVEIPVRIKDLLNDGNIASNVVMQPGDILIIPESWL